MKYQACLHNFQGISSSEIKRRAIILDSPIGFGACKFAETMVALQHRPHRLLLDTESGAQAPENGSRTQSSYTNEANFDTNMVIILAALLCALIFALGLNSIVRCALRCSRRLAFETPHEAAARLAATGLKKSALRQIPVAVYGSGMNNIKATDCTICLVEFMDGEKVRVLPKCKHGFHVKCIDTWLMSHSSCPTCRHSLVEQPVTSTSDAADADGGIRHSGNASGGQDDVVLAVDEIEVLINLNAADLLFFFIHIGFSHLSICWLFHMLAGET